MKGRLWVAALGILKKLHGQLETYGRSYRSAGGISRMLWFVIRLRMYRVQYMMVAEVVFCNSLRYAFCLVLLQVLTSE